jgi:aspartate aminotransferase
MHEAPRLSQLAETLVGSEIVRMNGEIRQRMEAGHRIFNFTIGDFDPQLFPIPAELEEEIVFAYRRHLTHYPAGEGEPDLRRAIARYIADRQGLSYGLDEILVASGGRPLIYTLYRSIVDPGEKVVYPVPSWNNNHYVHLVGGAHAAVVTTAGNRFMPSAADLRPHIADAVLLALSSPLNPSGTTFTREGLQEIAEMVAEENRRRPAGAKKLHVMFDQIYWQLTHKGAEHVDPVSLCPALRDCTVFVDGISKCFAATGVRVGWAMGPAHIIARMKSILSHIGAWSPMPEQMATSRYLLQKGSVDPFLNRLRRDLYERLDKIHKGFQQLRKDGLPVDSIVPQASIYLTVNIDLKGRTTPDGQVLQTQDEVTAYLLDKAGLALVPFHVFGMDRSEAWYRLSVGTVKMEEIRDMLKRLKEALKGCA